MQNTDHDYRQTFMVDDDLQNNQESERTAIETTTYTGMSDSTSGRQSVQNTLPITSHPGVLAKEGTLKI